MEGFNQCQNGHYYKNNLSECPYCPKLNTEIGLFHKTPVMGNTISDNSFDKTQISNTENSFSNEYAKTQLSGTGNLDKTQISGMDNFDKTQVVGVVNNNTSTKKDFSRTFIQDTDINHEGVSATNQIRQARKLSGWIVSFTLDPMGLDYRIYEGTNTIGRDNENTITISEDMSISGKHVSILSKKGKFYIKDEMAANGTFINNEELEIGKSYDLNDGDEIKLGKTVFKFRSSF